MNTIVIDLIIALALVAGGGYLVHRHYAPLLAAKALEAKEAGEARDALIKARKVDEASMAQLSAKKATIARSGASARASLAAASSAQAYLDQPVPQEVLDALK